MIELTPSQTIVLSELSESDLTFNELMKTERMSETTLRKTIRQLNDEGLIRKRNGKWSSEGSSVILKTETPMSLKVEFLPVVVDNCPELEGWISYRDRERLIAHYTELWGGYSFGHGALIESLIPLAKHMRSMGTDKSMTMLMAAVSGARLNPWQCGWNESGKIWDAWGTIFKSIQRVEDHAKYYSRHLSNNTENDLPMLNIEGKPWNGKGKHPTTFKVTPEWKRVLQILTGRP